MSGGSPEAIRTDPARYPALFHGIGAMILAVTGVKLGLAHDVIPRSDAVVGLNVAIVAFVALWALGALRLRRYYPGLYGAAALVALVGEAFYLLPMLHGQNHTLSVFYAACLGQSIGLLFYGAFAETRPTRYVLPVLALAHALLIARRTPQAPPLLAYLLVVVPLLLFIVALLLRIALDQKRQTEDLYERQRELNQTLAIAGKRILEQQKQATLAQITAGVAHEINNPVNVLSGNLPFLEEHFRSVFALAEGGTQDPEKLHALARSRADVEAILRRYREGVTRIAETVAALRKMFSTKPSVADTHDLSAIVRASAEYVGLRRQEGIEHWLDLTEPLPFRCAPADFHMVFSNLFTNAMEAVGERGVVFVTGRRTDQGISIAVEDNGRGVSSEDLIRIYEPFFTTKTGGGNLGIGLTLCRNIVESYGGSMSIESEEGRRTRVAVLLPLEAS